MTLDDIINNTESAKNSQQQPPVVTPQPKPVETAASAQPVYMTSPIVPTRTPLGAMASVNRPDQGKEKLSMAELYQRLNPNPQLTPEELAKERKKQKREAIFAAIGDGIAAMSNLFFTTKGAPNSYNPQYSLSDAYKKRYDKLKEDREAKQKEWNLGYQKAVEYDQNELWRQRAWDRQEARDKLEDERYNAKTSREEQWHKEETDFRQRQLDALEAQRKESNAIGWANYNLNKTAQQENARLRELGLKISGAKGVRGKRIGFSDGKGNEVGIYENVWKGSMQQVFDAISADLRPTDEKEAKKWDRTMKKLDTPQKKEDFVKQNWSKSRNASSIMMALSRIDPATMVSGLEGDEDNDDDSTPPSMRNQTNDDDNTPPSKRK